MSAIGNKAFPNFDGSTLRSVTTKQSARAGYVNVIELDGTVLSVQPDGTQQTRPAGTDAGYEQGQISGGAVLYQPEAPTGEVFAVPFWK